MRSYKSRAQDTYTASPTSKSDGNTRRNRTQKKIPHSIEQGIWDVG